MAYRSSKSTIEVSMLTVFRLGTIKRDPMKSVKAINKNKTSLSVIMTYLTSSIQVIMIFVLAKFV